MALLVKLLNPYCIPTCHSEIKIELEIDHKVTGLFACFSPDPNIMPKDIEEKRKKMKPDGVQIIDVDLDD